jgi:hypothetical protein
VTKIAILSNSASLSKLAGGIHPLLVEVFVTDEGIILIQFSTIHSCKLLSKMANP